MGERKIKWDEQAISEHDKTRGTRMKIKEPKTPYNYYNEDDDPDLVDVSKAIPKLEEIKTKQDFQEKRKHHYNEYEIMKQFREKQMKEEEDD